MGGQISPLVKLPIVDISLKIMTIRRTLHICGSAPMNFHLHGYFFPQYYLCFGEAGGMGDKGLNPIFKVFSPDCVYNECQLYVNVVCE